VYKERNVEDMDDSPKSEVLSVKSFITFLKPLRILYCKILDLSSVPVLRYILLCQNFPIRKANLVIQVVFAYCYSFPVNYQYHNLCIHLAEKYTDMADHHNQNPILSFFYFIEIFYSHMKNLPEIFLLQQM